MPVLWYQHMDSGFTKDRPKPTSLLYVLNADDNTAKATYEHKLSDWTAQYIIDKLAVPPQINETISMVNMELISPIHMKLHLKTFQNSLLRYS